MNPDVSIHITISSGSASVTTRADSLSGADAPPPMPLEQLRSTSYQGVPRPLSPEELAAVSASPAGAMPPAPMPIDQLRAYGVTAPPAPQPLEMLGRVEAAPRPLEPSQLGAPPTTGQDPDKL